MHLKLLNTRFLISLMISAHVSILIAAHASAAVERKVGVTGQCTRSATPDRAELTVTSDFQDKDIKAAIRKATEAYEGTLSGVKKLKLADLEVETSEYTVNEVKEWEKDRAVLKGYKARMGLKVSTSSVSQLGQVIAVAADEGLRDVGQLRMFLSEDKQNLERAACLKAAAQDARNKAKELASALGAHVTKVISIQEQGVRLEPPTPRPMMAMAMADESMGKRMPPPPVEAGKQQVSISVEAVFELE